MAPPVAQDNQSPIQLYNQYIGSGGQMSFGEWMSNGQPANDPGSTGDQTAPGFQAPNVQTPNDIGPIEGDTGGPDYGAPVEDPYLTPSEPGELKKTTHPEKPEDPYANLANLIKKFLAGAAGGYGSGGGGRNYDLEQQRQLSFERDRLHQQGLETLVGELMKLKGPNDPYRYLHSLAGMLPPEGYKPTPIPGLMQLMQSLGLSVDDPALQQFQNWLNPPGGSQPQALNLFGGQPMFNPPPSAQQGAPSNLQAPQMPQVQAPSQMRSPQIPSDNRPPAPQVPPVGTSSQQSQPSAPNLTGGGPMTSFTPPSNAAANQLGWFNQADPFTKSLLSWKPMGDTSQLQMAPPSGQWMQNVPKSGQQGAQDFFESILGGRWQDMEGAMKQREPIAGAPTARFK